ncbi:MAG TPA: OsmC family protein [Micromonosporaceae bacterium]|nr:OsmC family protein [Micromonosporaceae bacterium]
MPDSTSWADTATATAGAAHVRTDDGELSVALASPLAPQGSGLTPEQLLSAAFASCLHHAAVEVATDITDEAHTVEVRAHTRLARDADGRYRADIQASIGAVGLSREQLAELADRARRLWPFPPGDGQFSLSVTPA